jgi:hypothetical protein
MDPLQESVNFINAFKASNPDADKAAVQKAWVDWASPEKMSSVFVANGFAIRFSEAMTGGFSNTVVSLSALAKHDARPFVVVVVRRSSVDLMLANATFLKRVSHSSQQLRLDNVKGSFNGPDIMTVFEGTPNRPEHFDDLFALHSAFEWEENLERLVEATNEIIARNTRFEPSKAELEFILNAPSQFAAAMVSQEFRDAESNLIARMDAAKADILSAAQIDNVNIRGNVIEQLITGDGNAHELGDVTIPLGAGDLVIDLKTKLLDRASAPKAYNVDKLLRLLSKPGSVFAFFMIGVDVGQGEVSGRLLTVLDDHLRKATVVQHHWAGRGSRGVTQLSGNFGQALSASYKPAISPESAQTFLRDLVDL